MDAFIKELNRRYKAVQNTTGSQFVVSVCDYLKLLERQEVQDILLQHKDQPDIAELNIWYPYYKTRMEVYEPYQQHPELFEKTFAHFYKLDEWVDMPLVAMVMPKTLKAIWQKFKYRSRIERIHKRLPILLRDKELLLVQKPVVKRLEFDSEKGKLCLNEYEIPINRHGSITDQHRILAFIFKHDNLRQEFFYADMCEEIFGEDYDSSKHPRRFWDNCELINQKVASATKGLCPKFLLPTLEKRGLVKINPDCWELFR